MTFSNSPLEYLLAFAIVFLIGACWRSFDNKKYMP